MANPAFVQGGTGTASGTPLTLSLTGVSAGDVIVLGVRWTNGNSFPITGVSDNENSGNWSAATTQQNISNEGTQMWVGVMTNVGAGGDVTITVSWGSGFPSGIFAAWEEISGINTTTPIQPSGGSTQTTGTGAGSITTASLTTGSAETWAAAFCYATTAILTATGTLTEREQDAASPSTKTILSDALIATNGSSIAAQFSDSGGSANWAAHLVLLQPPASGTTTNKVHNADCYVGKYPQNKISHADCYVQFPGLHTHSADCYIGPKDHGHGADAYISPFINNLDIVLMGNIQFPIKPNAYIKLAGLLATPTLNYVQLNGTIQSKNNLSSVNLAGLIQERTRGYVKLAGTIENPSYRTHSADCDVSVQNLGFIQMVATINSPLQRGPCGSYPDASYVNLRGWIVVAGQSIQMPGSGYTAAEDFLSSQTALAAYIPMSVMILNGIALIVTAFTTGVVTWQTRTRAWLTRLDVAPSGILLTTTTNTHTLPNGSIITTTTNVTQNQDAVVTETIIQNSATPTRTSTIITTKNKYGQTTVREIDTVNINGVVTQTESKQVYSQPPTTENIQPLKVTTLDGVQHYQFFSQENTQWAGGDAEGNTLTNTQTTIVPGTLNGKSTDDFGNPILAKVTNQTVNTPDGKLIETTTTETGIQDAGTTTTDTASTFQGIQTVVQKTVNAPDGSQTVTTTTTNNLTGDSTEIDVETVTDEYGQVTVTTTTTDTKTSPNPTTGVMQTVVTKTVVVNKGGVTTTDTQLVTTNNFEDDIVNLKVQVYFIQEFTVNVVIDELSMFALWEINQTQQKNYALLELFGQQLGNANLSYALRQSLINQFNTANSCIAPVPFQANGRTYNVVFAASASAFRAKYIPGTEPHVYELQIILQERSNLINGTLGFF